MRDRTTEENRTSRIVYPTESYAIIGACFEVYNDKIIVEIKSVSTLNDVLRCQVHNYLKATSLRLGLLVNFGNKERLEYERIVR